MTIDLSRRSFLRGMSALVAAPAVIRVAKLMPISAPKLDLVYGRSPAMDALQAMSELNEYVARALAAQISETLFYGDANARPATFSGISIQHRLLRPNTPARIIALHDRS